MTLTLQGAGDAYTGQVEFNGRVFPLEAQADAASNPLTLNGTFESEGNRFAFSGVLEGNTLNFSTGNATYTLQKAGGEGQSGGSTLSAAGAPQPPRESLTLSYTGSSYNRAAPTERETSTLSVEIEALENGQYRVRSYEEGELIEEFTLDAQGYAYEAGERSDDFLPPWNPGRTDFFGASWQVAREGDLWIYRVQEDDAITELSYDASSGHLTHALGCESDDCFELLLAPAPGNAPISQ